VSENSELIRPPGSYRFRGHIAELDSIRAIGIGIVLLNHFWPTTMTGVIFQLGQLGWIAMDAFFVLSGFLITGILLDTRSRPDYFSNYYIRRSLRIFPLYYVTLLAAIVMLKLGQGGAEYKAFVHDWGSPVWFFAYLGNFRMAYTGSFPPSTAFGVLWSLQIEEQFYLLFPLAVRYLRTEQLTRLLWCLVFLSPAFRVAFYLWNPNNLVIQNVLLPCHMEGLALGALIAIRFRSGPWELPKIRLTILTIGLLLLTCIGSIVIKPPRPDLASLSVFSRLPGYSLASWSAACLVIWLVVFRGSRFTSMLRTAPIRYMAMISYGIYLLHPLISRFERSWGQMGFRLQHDTILRFAIVVAMSIGAASLSWYAFERPIARLKDRLAPSRQQPEASPVAKAAESERTAPVGAAAASGEAY
jgi:peptidoglycan/LPS O-acetylase OafA/YrhL